MENQSGKEQDRDWLELSLAQQAIWLDAKLSGGALYQLGGWARISGHLDELAVRQAVSLVMARHDALRLRVDEEQPRQWLDSSAEPPVSIVHLAEGPDLDAAFQAHVERTFASPIPWGDHPLFRIELIRAGSNLWYVLWRFHHLVADSTSMTLAMRHWTEAYLALTSDDAPELAPRSSYLDIIASDSAYLKSPDYQQDLSYWVSRFEPLPPALIPPAGKRSGAGAFFADWTLDGDAGASLERSARDARVSAQRLLFGIFAVILGQRYGRWDLVAGIALHRRQLANRNALGVLSGVIPVRCRFDPSWSLREGVQRFSAQIDSDLRHQRMPVDKLSRALGLFRTGRARLYEAVMSYIPADREQEGLHMEGLPVTNGVPALPEASPISLHLTELSGRQGLTVRLCVNPDLLDGSEASALLLQLQHTLTSFFATPEMRIGSLSPMARPEAGWAEGGLEEWAI